MKSIPLPKNICCTLDCLPFDIIVYVLQLQGLTVNDLMVFVEALPHYIDISMHVLRYYQLPQLQIRSIMDQEGKRQHITPFFFYNLDTDHCWATFVAHSGFSEASKRFISNRATAERPRLRQISLRRITHSSQEMPVNNQSIIGQSLATGTSAFSGGSITGTSSFRDNAFLTTTKDTIPDTAVDEGKRRSIWKERPNSAKSITNSDNVNMVRPHHLSLKEGFHTISTISSSDQCLQKMKTLGVSKSLAKEKWQYSYYVSGTNKPLDSASMLACLTKDKKATGSSVFRTDNSSSRSEKEHVFVSPISITVSLSVLRSSSISSNFTKPVALTSIPRAKHHLNLVMKKLRLH
ncbi:hypothetical protein [Absidia glauca]|uniref:Uncharacterized protein n=1 Tax=Absidia glauca TaxID=4829 RepID=A0A168PPP7_ABSGL|nr:hypothetical protein [Absidia glauca]